MVHPRLGAWKDDPRVFVREAFKYNPETWDGRIMYSLARALNFSLDSPWESLPDAVRQLGLPGLFGANYIGLDALLFSAGLTEHRAGEAVTDTIARAGQALHSAKTQGRNRVVLL